MKLKFFGIALAAALCLLVAPRAKAQPSCVSVGTTKGPVFETQFYTVTNDCAVAIEGVFITKSGGAFSFGPLASGETSQLQSTETGPYRLYVCDFPRLPRITVDIDGWANWNLPAFGSDPSRVACQ